MKGLILGKFMPLHSGHINIIDYALSLVDELLILVVSKDGECIDGSIRVEWLEITYKNEPRVKVQRFHHQLPHDGVFTQERMLMWCEAIKSSIPQVDLVVSSESYGAFLAEYLGAAYRVYDQDRKQVNLSGTEIRRNPKAYFDYLPACVQSYYRQVMDAYEKG